LKQQAHAEVVAAQAESEAVPVSASVATSASPAQSNATTGTGITENLQHNTFVTFNKPPLACTFVSTFPVLLHSPLQVAQRGQLARKPRS
jgi:hypothetical protein